MGRLLHRARAPRPLHGRVSRRARADRDRPDVIRDPYRASDATEYVDRLLDVDVQTYLPGDLLVKMDIATMAHSLEVRSPLLDHQFMEMAAACRARRSCAADGQEGLQGRAAPLASRPHPRSPEDGVRSPDRRLVPRACATCRASPARPALARARVLPRGVAAAADRRHLERRARTNRTGSGPCSSSSSGCAPTSTATRPGRSRSGP